MGAKKAEPSPETSDVLILTIGGAPAPIVQAVKVARPKVLGLLTTAQSGRDWSAAVVPQLDESERTWTEECSENLEKGHENDLRMCIAASRRLLQKVRACAGHGVPITVAFTGGTKPMTAGLVLACQLERARYLYIAGDRDKDGKGIVQDGTETPLWVDAVLELRAGRDIDLCLHLFRQGAYSAVLDLLNRLREDIRAMGQQVPLEIDAFADLCHGYLYWDRLDWGKAREALKRAQNKIKNLRTLQFETLAPLKGEPSAKALGEVVDHLENLLDTRRDNEAFLLREIFNNAERRMRLERYDDALLRYYRYLELVAQNAVRRVLHAPTSAIPLESLPETVRAAYRNAPELYEREGRHYLRLAMVRSFELLEKLGAQEGRQFMAHQETIRQLTDKRNQSVLAHGLEPIPEKVVRRLHDLIKTLFGLPEPLPLVES